MTTTDERPCMATTLPPGMWDDRIAARGARILGESPGVTRLPGLAPQTQTQSDALPDAVRGHAEPGFHRAVEAFAKLVTRGRGGGALVVRRRGETVLDLCTGWADRAHTRPWQL